MKVNSGKRKAEVSCKKYIKSNLSGHEARIKADKFKDFVIAKNNVTECIAFLKTIEYSQKILSSHKISFLLEPNNKYVEASVHNPNGKITDYCITLGSSSLNLKTAFEGVLFELCNINNSQVSIGFELLKAFATGKKTYSLIKEYAEYSSAEAYDKVVTDNITRISKFLSRDSALHPDCYDINFVKNWEVQNSYYITNDSPSHAENYRNQYNKEIALLTREALISTFKEFITIDQESALRISTELSCFIKNFRNAVNSLIAAQATNLPSEKELDCFFKGVEKFITSTEEDVYSRHQIASKLLHEATNHIEGTSDNLIADAYIEKLQEGDIELIGSL